MGTSVMSCQLPFHPQRRAGDLALKVRFSGCTGRHTVKGNTMMPGGTSQEHPPTPEVQEIINTVRKEVEEKLGRTVSQFTLLAYKTQVVAGMNYFAKVDIGEEDVVHVRVYRDLQQNISLSAVQHPKARDHDIQYFQQ